jgi:Rieske 2Fe-2S family protein
MGFLRKPVNHKLLSLKPHLIQQFLKNLAMKNQKMMHALPVEAYTSKEWFDKEMKHLFSTTWQFAGLVEDVAEPGDYISVQAGLNNIFIIKGRDHRLRAFHNICRHRGTQLLRAVGKAQKSITCPYHDWTYDLEGGLMSVPKQDSEFPELKNKKLHTCNLNLKEASVDIFKGMLFVHPEKDAPSIKSFFGPVEEYLGEHRPEELMEYSENPDAPFYTKEINANWKIIVENYIDHYHLAHLHENTLNMYDHEKAEFGWAGPHYWFHEPLVKEYREDLENASPYPLIDHMSEENIGAYVPWLFPNIGITESESAWNTFHVVPLAPDRTLVTIRSKVMNVSEWEFTKQAAKSSMSAVWTKYGNKGKYVGDAENDPMASGDFMWEDIYACEQQQKSLTSPYFSVGAMAQRGEYAIQRFQEEVKKWMEKHQ